MPSRCGKSRSLVFPISPGRKLPLALSYPTGHHSWKEHDRSVWSHQSDKEHLSLDHALRFGRLGSSSGSSPSIVKGMESSGPPGLPCVSPGCPRLVTGAPGPGTFLAALGSSQQPWATSMASVIFWADVYVPSVPSLA